MTYFLISMDFPWEFPGVRDGQSIWLVDSMDGRNLTRKCTCNFFPKKLQKKRKGQGFFLLLHEKQSNLYVCVCFFVGFSVFCLSASPVCWKIRESHGEACPATPSLLLRRPSVGPSKVSYVDWWLAAAVCFTALSVCLHSHLLSRRYW